MPVIVQITIQDVPDEKFVRTQAKIGIQCFGVVSARAMQQAHAAAEASKLAIMDVGQDAKLAVYTEPQRP